MATPIVMPKLGMVMAEGTINRWTKSPGESVQQGDVIAEIETEKINYDLEATESGVFHPVVDAGAIVEVDGLLGYILADGEAVPEAPEPQPAASAPAPIGAAARQRPAAPARAAGDVVPSTPGARRLAANLDVDISLVTPSGPRGRVVEADVRAFAEQQAGPSIPPGLPTPSKVVPMTGMRKAVAQHMHDSLSNTAQLSYFLEVDVTEAQRLRREASRDAENTIAIGHVIIKACAETLARIPAVNTVVSGDDILYFDEVNIGLAVALDDGLIVPVVKNVESKTITQISNETTELAARARDNTLTPDQVVGGTFTVSVLGSVDGFTPILNPGQSALMGVGRSVQKPVVRSGEIVIREMMTVSLTADHRVIDGAVAASFLRRFQQMIERPSQLFG